MQQVDIRPVRVEGGLLAELHAAHAADALRLAYLLTGVDCAGPAIDSVRPAKPG